MGIGHWALGIGHWALGIGHWALETGDWALVILRVPASPPLPISPSPHLPIPYS
ncbi:MAG: hypothetical protein RMY29_011480 [Nostoc sp. CreGUA01]